MIDKTLIKRVLITGVGGPTPRSFVRAIKYFGGEYKDSFEFIGVDSNPLAYGLYDRDLFCRSFIVPRAEDTRYWDVINAIVEENAIDAAIILPEIEVLEWSKNYTKLNKKIKLHLPDYRLAKDLINKYKLHSLLKDTGYIPAFSKLSPGHYSFNNLKNAVGDTFWIRGTEGSSGFGSLKIDSEKLLAQWITMNADISEFIATEYLPGRNMACKLLYFNDKLLATACAERVKYIMAKTAPSGITGNTSFGRLLNEPRLVDISTSALNIMSKKIGAGLNGIFTIDFKEDIYGNPKITEVNIRHVAFTSSLAAAGANLPLRTLLALFDETGAVSETTHYTFKEQYVFLRDVDAYPIVIKESDLFLK
jgi:carbamoyl-phosphate synthase large subunit